MTVTEAEKTLSPVDKGNERVCTFWGQGLFPDHARTEQKVVDSSASVTVIKIEESPSPTDIEKARVCMFGGHDLFPGHA